MFYVYILKSQNSGRYYVGSTHDLLRRLEDHNRGKTKATKNKGPWLLIHQEEFLLRIDALNRERQIKSYKGGNAFKKLIDLI